MKDESRIEALEHELKILKNEIQSTLLEIREQILNHYYPELRAEEPLRTISRPMRPQVGYPRVPLKNAPRTPEPSGDLSEIEAKGQIQPFTDIFLEDLEDDDEGELDEDKTNGNGLANSRPAPLETAFDSEFDEEFEDLDRELDDEPEAGQPDAIAPQNTAPQTREVSFRQLKENAAAPKAKPSSVPKRSDTPPTSANRQTFAALASWVTEAMNKVGKERAIQIIETYATGGKLPNESRSSIMQMISLADDKEPAKTVGSQEMLSLMVALDQILG